jgi:hypothetical protein
MKIVRFTILLLLVSTLWYSCVKHSLFEPTTPLELSLRWVKAYPDETDEKMMHGLTWNLSFLGARLPAGAMQQATSWRSSSVFTLDFALLGFSADSEQALIALFQKIKESSEYRQYGAIDVGRFVMLTLNSSYHYFAITGVLATLDEFKAKYTFKTLTGAVINSSIAKGHREVQVSDGTDVESLAFIAAEGTGTLPGSFDAQEFETINVMANGQLRFGLYDKNGQIKASASSDLTSAGKPSKCLWCHEINFQKLNNMTSVEGHLSFEEFSETITAFNEIVAAYRSTLESDIDFTQPEGHTLGELLYISFMEPSAYRLSNEWSMSSAEVETALKGHPMHTHSEFPFLGNLYNRKTVDPSSPFEGIAVPDDAREPSVYEPKLISP